MEVLTYISCMDTAYVRENPTSLPPKITLQGCRISIFGYLKTFGDWTELTHVAEVVRLLTYGQVEAKKCAVLGGMAYDTPAETNVYI